jgi:hypothetical protein
MLDDRRFHVHNGPSSFEYFNKKGERGEKRGERKEGREKRGEKRGERKEGREKRGEKTLMASSIL